MMETDEEKRVREEHLRELVAGLVRSGALVDEPRIYVRDENSPETGFCRELTPGEIDYKRMTAIDAGDAFAGEKTGEDEAR